MKTQILLSYFSDISYPQYEKIIQKFSTVENFWHSRKEELKKTNWKEEKINNFIEWRKNLNIEKIKSDLEKENLVAISYFDAEYPENLKTIYDPPLTLFVRGDLSVLKTKSISVVGTRKSSEYGKFMTKKIVAELCRNGITIVSGLAYGIDQFAHLETIASGGKTIAVLGGGADNKTIMPRMNFNLSQKIIANGGAVLSEYPPYALPTVYTFPKRNRIVAGLSLGTLVIEAPKKSGSLITAQCALDNGREVFAVPQNATAPNSEGPHELIRNGACLVTSAEEILNFLGIENKQEQTKIKPENELEKQILDLLSLNPTHINDIIKTLKIDSNTVSGALTIMEINGKVLNLGGMTYHTRLITR